MADASSTGEVLRDVLRELDVPLTPEIAEALYVALVTDTGRFQYTNTTPKAHGLAKELLEAGADVHRVFQGVYESMRAREAEAAGAARSTASRCTRAGGSSSPTSCAPTSPRWAQSSRTRRESSTRCGPSTGAELAVLIREPPRSDGPTRRVSLRASVDELDVSSIARGAGGGGHRQAAGFSSEASVEEITEFIRSAYQEQRNGAAPRA